MSWSDCTTKEIRERFKKLALRWHPDKNIDNPEEAQKVRVCDFLEDNQQFLVFAEVSGNICSLHETAR